jgi:hypothetical protein
MIWKHGFMIMKLIITRDHFQLHWSEKYQKTGIRILLFLFKGKGYYDYKEDADMDYGLFPLEL